MPNRESPVHARISSDLSKSAKHDGLNGERSGFEPSYMDPARSQAARSTKVKPVAFVYTASVRSSVICSGP